MSKKPIPTMRPHGGHSDICACRAYHPHLSGQAAEAVSTAAEAINAQLSRPWQELAGIAIVVLYRDFGRDALSFLDTADIIRYFEAWSNES